MIEINEETSKYMDAIVNDIIKEIGPRMPCSPAEARAADRIKGEMEKTCDEVTVEPFTCHPRAFLGWVKIDVLCVVASLLLFQGASAMTTDGTWLGVALAVSVSLVGLGLAITIKEFFNYDEFIDHLYKELPSQNVTGRIMAKTAPRKVLMFSGHHDSALQFNLINHLGIVGYGVLIFVGFGIFLFWGLVAGIGVILSIAGLPLNTIQSVSLWILVPGTPVVVAFWFFVSSGEKANKVPGAADNLSAVAVVLAIGKYIKEHPGFLPDDVEVRLISFGCEEAGLRGAYRYVEAHRDEIQRSGAVLYNMDGIQDRTKFMAFTFEPTTRTKHDMETTNNLIEAAHSHGISMALFGNSLASRLGGWFSGGTDAAAFSKAGLKASSFGAINILEYARHYHTVRDTPDKITPGTLEECLKIVLGIIEKERNNE